MTNKILEKITLTADQKSSYLAKLDRYIRAVATTLKFGMEETQLRKLKEFGGKENWDWSRIPLQEDTYKELGEMVDFVRKQYQWLDWKENEKNPTENMGFFDETWISTFSGLPCVSDIIKLAVIKKDSPELLASSKNYQQASIDLIRLLLEDNQEISDVRTTSENMHAEALKRNFLENLTASDLISWNNQGSRAEARKIIPFGGEDLWRVKYSRFMPSTNIFEIYLMDVWQDIRQPQIIEAEGKITVSKDLEEAMKFGKENKAWFVLSEIDKMFKSLHPVHVSRGLIGPFENKYGIRAENPLQVSKEILEQDQDFSLLRFTRQYSYAPNHRPDGDEIKQIVYMDDWNDELLICPQRYTSRVSKSVLGTNVRVVGV
jgi:hypothetical protein